MAKKNTYQTYGSVSKFFHWTIFLLVLGMIIFGYCLDFFPKDLKGQAYNIHKLIGLLILALMILRALWALKNPKPRLPSTTPLWEIALERLMHLVLYLVLLAMPIAGWIMSSAANKAPRLFGYNLILPVPQTEHLKHLAKETHEILAIVIIVLVVLHVLAAFKHHFINKDHVLKRMAPCSKG